MPEIPTSPAAAACFEAVAAHSPDLSSALKERLLPLAEDASRPADQRIRELRGVGGEAWEALKGRDDFGSISRALGKSWICCVEDLTAAVALEAAESADRDLLERVLAALQEAPPGMLSTARAGMRLRGAIAAAS